MKEFLDKISSYNIFNYLFPGVLFAYIITNFCGYNLIQKDILIGVFLYYFIGMIVSRFGSICLEPFLKWINFLKFESYKDFVVASQKDSKIELLSEVNNTYRTLISMLLLALLSKVYASLFIHSYYNTLEIEHYVLLS
ncbi:MAG: hypothetical protein ACOVRK_02370 [Chryseobacterium taeanense]